MLTHPYSLPAWMHTGQNLRDHLDQCSNKRCKALKMIYSEHELSLQRTLKAQTKHVWRAWAVAKHLQKWWTPAPVKTIVNKLDLVPGGAFDTLIEMPDGSSHEARGTFLNIVENRLIVFTDALHEGWIPSGTGFMTVFITLAETGNCTQYDVRVAHRNAEDRQRHLAMGFEKGWNQTISQLEQVAIALMEEEHGG